MVFDTTIQLGDIIMAVVALGLIPLMRLLVTTLWDLREGLQKLQMIVVGSSDDHASGLLGDVSELKKESQRHRNWLIKIQAESGMKMDDRS